MAISYPDLSTLDESQVQAVLNFLSQRLGEYAPNLERKRGVLRDIVLQLESVFSAATAEVVNIVNQSNSLLLLQQNPAGADPSLVDKVLGNYRITRRPGSVSKGTVTLILDSLVAVTIPSGFQFTANGVVFTADSSYAARTSAGSVVSSTDRLITALSNGTYAFNINVTAASAGSAGQIRSSSPLVPVNSFGHFVQAFASNDFTGGADAQTNAELLADLQNGMADKSPSNRLTLQAMILSLFPSILATSVVGYGDAEQVRYHSIFPVAFGGRVDVYARTQALPATIKLSKTATLVTVLPRGGVWQTAITRDEAPGFYEVAHVDPAGAVGGGYEVTELLRGLDVSADGNFLPDVETTLEAAFSRFQTAVVRFVDDNTDASALTAGVSTNAYDLYVTAMPLVKDLQLALGDRSRRSCDVLVKAPIPCFVSLSFTVTKRNGEADPPVSRVQNDLARYVNGLGFPGALNASSLSHVVSGNLASTQSVGVITMTGRLLRPGDITDTDLTSESSETSTNSSEGLPTIEEKLSSTIVLTVPTEPDYLVSANTVAFILDPSDVAITIEVA
jgi:hypothetical protein